MGACVNEVGVDVKREFDEKHESAFEPLWKCLFYSKRSRCLVDNQTACRYNVKRDNGILPKGFESFIGYFGGKYPQKVW
jgi:hypothetical protein